METAAVQFPATVVLFCNKRFVIISLEIARFNEVDVSFAS